MRLLITRGEVWLERILPQKLSGNKSFLSVLSLRLLCVFCNAMPTKAERKRFSSQNKSKTSQSEHVPQYCRRDVVLHWLVICFVIVRKFRKYLRCFKSQGGKILTLYWTTNIIFRTAISTFPHRRFSFVIVVVLKPFSVSRWLRNFFFQLFRDFSFSQLLFENNFLIF